VRPSQRRWVFFVGLAGLVAFYLWGLTGLPGFGRYPGPYGDVITNVAVGQTNATGVVSAVNFEYRGFDTVGEEFILLIAAIGVSTVLRHLRAQQEEAEERADDEVSSGVPATSDAVRLAALVFVGLVAIVGWLLVTHAQTNPSGGFQGGVVLATAVIMIYLAGESLVFERVSPVDIIDSAEATGAGGFAAVGVAAVAMGLPYLTNFLPLGVKPGAVSSSGTIALISFFVGVEVTAAFVSIVGELLEQTLVTSREAR
jgi:multicomponent Na+:H+ antiporter subunit B